MANIEKVMCSSPILRRKEGTYLNECYMAINKTTGQFFGGKKTGTHIGYPKLNFLKSAMTNARVNKDAYHFVMISFDENLTPTLTKLS